MSTARMAHLADRELYTPSKPLVFISASSQDIEWREMLKLILSRYDDQLEWWDDSRVSPGGNWADEIEAAIQRASLAVVLLSPAYLSSRTATSELERLGKRAESGYLRLFPIVLHECSWQEFKVIREVQIWKAARPVGELRGEAVRREWDEITKSIVEVAIDRQGTRPNLEPEAEIDPPEPASLPEAERISHDADREREVEQPRPAFLFSTTARAALDLAWSLAEKSGRPAITSSCLLFAMADRSGPQSDTTRFVNRLVNLHGRYQAVFDAFLKEGTESQPRTTVIPGLPWKFSRNARALVEQALIFSLRVGDRPGEVHARHLFAALLVARPADRPLAARSRLTSMGLERAALPLEFRKHLLIHASRDNSTEWDAILGKPASESDDPTAKATTEIRPSAMAVAYQRTYSAFVPDRAAFRHRAVDAPLDDALGVGVHAGHLAQLIAAKDTFMPLSIGLFGAWGAGKSHFIDLLDEQLRQVTKQPGQVFHQQIVQIRFNAWHYLDTNLWANLVSEIFDQLFAKLDERKDTSAAQVENLKKELANQSALAAEAKVALQMAENTRKLAEKKLSREIRKRVRRENQLGALLDDLTVLLVSNDEVRQELVEVADGLGMPKLESSFAELEQRAEEVRSLSGRVKALGLAVFTGPGWWSRAVLLGAAVALPLGVAALAAYGPAWMKDLLAGAGRSIAQIVTGIAALSTWLAVQAKAGNALVGKLESAYDKVKKVRAEREASDEAAQAQRALAAKRQAEEAARHALREAEERMKSISAELAEMAPGRQLIRFLKQRASAEDYRRHLGLVSLVRRDFEQLSNLLLDTRGTTEAELPKIDRIVLYIDDLDRCRADRVIEVLEAVHLLLAFPLFAVVVAVDPRWLRQSLLDHYPRLLGGADEELTSQRKRRLGRPATPQDYLEKIFQVPFNLQAMEKTGFEALVTHLFPVKSVLGKVQQSAPVEQPPVPASEPAPDSPAPEITTTGETNITVDAIATQPAASPPPATAPAEEKPLPLDPERLTLTQKEVTDVQRFQLLFQTPRSVKRLANTYSLIRVGVDPDEWDSYLGVGENAGAYRVPLLLLAVSSAFPALARPWLLWLRETPPARWQLDMANVATLFKKSLDTTDHDDWVRLKRSLDQLSLDDWPVPQSEPLAKWVPRVARYSF